MRLMDCRVKWRKDDALCLKPDNGGDLDWSHLSFLAQPALQRLTIPLSQIRRRVIGALQEFHQRSIRITRRANGIVRQQKLAQLLAEERLRWPHLRRAKAVRRWIGVRIERRIIDRPAATRPETGARHLVRISLLCHGIWQMWHTAGMARCGTARKPRHRQIKAAP